MPVVRKLDTHEVGTIKRKSLGVRKAVEAEYDGYLADFAPGDYGEVVPDASEKRLTVRNRLKAAAARRTPPLALVFHRVRGEALRFGVEAADAVPDTAAPPPSAVVAPPAPPPEPVVSSDEETAPKRPGRKRKQAIEAAASAPAEGSPSADGTPRRRKRKQPAAEG